jgi:tetratricopeptide (TPR) repeat protein
MEKEREKRYQTTAELLADLSTVEAALPAAERAPSRAPSRTKLKTSREITLRITPRKLFIPAAALLVLIVAVLIVLRLTSRGPILAYPTDKPSLAVLYFQNNTGDKSLDHWSTGLSDLLIYKRSQSKFLWVLPKDRLLSVLNLTGLQDARSYSADNIKKLASRQIGRYLMSGSFFKSGESFQVHSTIQDSRSGKVVGVLSEECQGEAGITGLIDSLSPRIKGALEVAEAKIAADIDRSLGEITTSSSEALRLFSEATDLYTRGKSSEAIELLKKAAELDPDFAMAHRQLWALYISRGRRAEAAEHIQKALALKDRVSDRERFIIEGTDYFNKRQWENLIEVSTRLVEQWPDDLLGNRMLGNAYFSLEE